MTKKNEKDAFDINEALDGIMKPSFFVDGFKAYLDDNNLKPKDKKEFEKLLKEFGEMRL